VLYQGLGQVRFLRARTKAKLLLSDGDEVVD